MWLDGLRISFGCVGRCLRFNFGRVGYAYWERNGKHGIVHIWRRPAPTQETKP